MNTTEEQNLHADHAAHHYVQALQTGLDKFYQSAVQAALDALHTEALAEDAARAARITAIDASNRAQYEELAAACRTAGILPRAYWLDDQLISGMFTKMTHEEIHDEYGQQEFLVVDGDFTDMFDLR